MNAKEKAHNDHIKSWNARKAKEEKEDEEKHAQLLELRAKLEADERAWIEADEMRAEGERKQAQADVAARIAEEERTKAEVHKYMEAERARHTQVHERDHHMARLHGPESKVRE